MHGKVFVDHGAWLRRQNAEKQREREAAEARRQKRDREYREALRKCKRLYTSQRGHFYRGPKSAKGLQG